MSDSKMYIVFEVSSDLKEIETIRDVFDSLEIAELQVKALQSEEPNKHFMIGIGYSHNQFYDMRMLS